MKGRLTPRLVRTALPRLNFCCFCSGREFIYRITIAHPVPTKSGNPTTCWQAKRYDMNLAVVEFRQCRKSVRTGTRVYSQGCIRAPETRKCTGIPVRLSFC